MYNVYRIFVFFYFMILFLVHAMVQAQKMIILFICHCHFVTFFLSICYLLLLYVNIISNSSTLFYYVPTYLRIATDGFTYLRIPTEMWISSRCFPSTLSTRWIINTNLAFENSTELAWIRRPFHIPLGPCGYRSQNNNRYYFIINRAINIQIVKLDFVIILRSRFYTIIFYCVLIGFVFI